MNILISGGLGYIGSYLVKILNEGNYNTGIITRNLPSHINEYLKKTEFIKADLAKPITAKPQKAYDVFIHLAAANDIDSKNPVTALTDTVMGTLNALEFCVKNNIKKFIYFSTFQVYGIGSGYADEKTGTLTLNHYALTHLVAEKYVEFYKANSGIDFIILRPTNIYGGMLSRNIDRWSLVPACFCKEAFEEQSITLLSSGKQQRDFVSLDNVSIAVQKLIERFDKAKNMVLNLGSGETKTIYDTAVLVKALYEKKYSRNCGLKVMSIKPEVTEELVVSTEKLKELGIETAGNNNMENEIIKIFELMEESKILPDAGLNLQV